jgi:predicted HTH domain antitoxin
MRHLESMHRLRAEIPLELVVAAGLSAGNLSEEAARLLALELYREDKVSLGRAAELCHTPIEQFMEFAGRQNAPLHYGADELDEDR